MLEWIKKHKFEVAIGGGITALGAYLLHRKLTRIPKNVLLFSWDAVQRDIFQELLDEGSLPFIQSLPHVVDMTCNTEFDVGTATRHQHAIMFSGYLVNYTGIRSNEPEKNDSPPARYGGISIPRAYTVFTRVRQWFGPNKPYIAGGTGKPVNVGDMLGFPGGLLKPAPPLEQRLYYNREGFDVFDDMAGGIAEYPPEIVGSGHNIGDRFLAIAENRPPFFYMFHFNDPDHTGHKYGTDSADYRRSIVNCDQVTGQIFKKLASSNPAIIVTSDHGMGCYPHPTTGEHVKNTHGNSPYTFLATNLPIVSDAYEFDVTPTIYHYLGIPYHCFSPRIQGESLMLPKAPKEELATRELTLEEEEELLASHEFEVLAPEP